jgi:hypothetical protein
VRCPARSLVDLVYAHDWTVLRSMLTKLWATLLAVLILSPSTAQFQARDLTDSAHGTMGHNVAFVVSTSIPAPAAEAPSSLIRPGFKKIRRLSVEVQPLSAAAECFADLSGRVVVRPNGVSRGHSTPPSVLRL